MKEYRSFIYQTDYSHLSDKELNELAANGWRVISIHQWKTKEYYRIFLERDLPRDKQVV
jgi:hypothetical protein